MSAGPSAPASKASSRSNWSAKLEYLYMDLDSYRTGTFTLAPLSTIGANVDLRFRDHILRVGLNYTFGGPVVAKY